MSALLYGQVTRYEAKRHPKRAMTWHLPMMDRSPELTFWIVSFKFLFCHSGKPAWIFSSNNFWILNIEKLAFGYYFLLWLVGKPSNFLKGLFLKGLSVNEDYYFLSAVHSFDVETFEFSVVLFLLLSIECVVNFYWGPARVNFDSSLFWNCIFTTEKNCGAGISNINKFSWTAGNQM